MIWKLLNKIRISLLFILIALIMAACNTVPITGRSQFLVTSVSQENQLGEEAWREINRKEKQTTNRKYSDAVKRVGQNIAAVSDAPGFEWEFKTFESKQANAFCLPGGKVAVYTGIFKYMDNDAELAAVIGHEVAHAIARHGGERISQEQARAIGQAVLSEVTDPKYRQLAVMVYGGATAVGVMLPYSRTHEYEADHMGLIYMAKAGYDPRYAVSFWEKFSNASKISGFEEFLSTHPVGEKRIQQMQQLLPEAMEIYNKNKIKRGSGQKY